MDSADGRRPRRGGDLKNKEVESSLDQVLAQIQVLSSITSSPIDSRQCGSGSSPMLLEPFRSEDGVRVGRRAGVG